MVCELFFDQFNFAHGVLALPPIVSAKRRASNSVICVVSVVTWEARASRLSRARSSLRSSFKHEQHILIACA